jgi:hypothetical protein
MAFRMVTTDGSRTPVQVITVGELREVLDQLQASDRLHFDSSVGMVYVYRDDAFRFNPPPIGMLLLEAGTLALIPPENRGP